MLIDTMNLSQRLACRAVGLNRSTYQRRPIAQTPADPDADLRAWLRRYATKHPLHGFRRAWAALRHDEGQQVNKKKVHRLWMDEGLQVKIYHPRKRAGVNSVPQIVADAPKVVWAIDFQFDSTVDGKAIKIASMIDEHTRLSDAATSLTDQSPHERLDTRNCRQNVRPCGVARHRYCGWTTAQEFISACAATVLRHQHRDLVYIPPGTPWNNGHIESFNNRLRKECLNRNHWTSLLEKPAWSSPISKTTTTTGTATPRWATSPQPSTVPNAPTPTNRWAA